MKTIFKLYILSILLISINLSASQKQTDNIANISAVSLYNIDKNTLQNTIKAYIKTNPNLKALKIEEKLSNEVYIEFYRKDKKIIYSKIPNLFFKDFKKFESKSKYENEEVGQVTAYFEDIQSSSFTKKEEQWIKFNPSINLAVIDNYPPYDFRDSNNKLKGFHSDFVNLMNKNLGTNIRLKTYTSWSEAFNAASSGNVHGILSLSWSKEREEKYFIYSSAYHFSPYYLVVNKNNSTVFDIKDLTNKKIAVEKDTIFGNVVSEKNPLAKIVLVDSTKKAYESVSLGETLATISPNINDDLFKQSGLKVASEIFHKSSNLHIGVNKQYPIVSSIIEKAIDSISVKDISSLRQKWLTKDSATIELNSNEKEWIKRNPIVKVVKFFDEPPFTLNSREKSGYIYELIEYLISSAGLSIEYIDGFKSYSEMIEAVETNKVDILTTIPTSMDLGENSNIAKSKSILKTPFVLIGHSNKDAIANISDLFGKKVAVVKGYLQDKYLSKFPQIEKVYVNNNNEGFEVIRNGKAEYYINNRANTEFVLNKSFLTDLQIVYEFPYDSFPPLSISFGISKDKKVLVTILKKALDQIPYKKVKTIRDKWILQSDITDKKIDFSKKEKKWLENNPLIKIALMRYWDSDDDGNSIHTDLIKLINKYGNLNILTTKYNTWKDGFYDASIGENIHGILNLAWSKEREDKYFEYIKGYQYIPHYLITKKDNKNIIDLNTLLNKTVYVKKKHIAKTRLINFSNKIDIIEITDNNDILKKLSSTNEADAAIVSNIKIDVLEKLGLKVVRTIYDKYNQGHLGINHKHEELISILKKVFEIIPRYELSELRNKVYKKTKEISINLTNEEKEFIKRHPKIRVHNEKDWAPFNFYEKSRARGLSIDYMKTLAKKAGIEIEFISGPSWNEFMEMAKNKEIDVILNIVKSESREKFLNFTKPYSELLQSLYIRKNEKIITKIEDLFGKTFAVPKGFYYEEKLKKYPEIKLLRLDNTLECIQAVSTGKADAMLDLTSVVYYYKRKFQIDNVVRGGTLGWEGGSLPLNIGVRKDWPELVSILNKSLVSLTDKELNEIENKWLFENKETKNKIISLTEEEKKWIRENVVKVGIEDWAPIIFSKNGKEANGITGDVLKLVQEKTGLKYEIVTGLWESLLKNFRNKKLDLLPATYYTDERATYGLYSKEYYKMLDYIYVRDDNNKINSMQDLIGRQVAIPKGFGTIPKIKKAFPKINIVETRDLTDSIQRVLRGEVDALFDGQIAVEYKIQEDLIVGLKGIPQKTFSAAPLHFFSHVDKPILRDILNKALKDIPSYEINKIKSKWLMEKRNQDVVKKIDNKQSSKDTLWLLIFAVSLFLFLLFILIIITRFISDDFVAKSFGSLKFRFIALIILSIVFFILSMLVYLTLSENKKNILDSTKNDLEFVLKMTQDRLDTWIYERKRFLIQMARDAELVELTKELLKVEKNADILKDSFELSNMREYFKKREEEFGSLGFFIIDRDFISIGSSHDYNLGTENLIVKHNLELIKRAFNGESLFIPPIVSNQASETKDNVNEHTIFFAIPIEDKDGNVIAVMTQKLDVEGKFSNIIQSGRLGKSGESYIFSKDAFMITKSRFRDELIEIGLLKKDEKEYEKLQLRDPGGNLKNGFKIKTPIENLPLTKMAKHAISLDSDGSKKYNMFFSDIEGYRDYRGVNVFGAWIWYKKYGIGLTTEIDEEEALKDFYTLKQNLLIITGLTLLLTVMAVIMLIILGEKATRSIQKANNKLNKLLESFDYNVIASKTDTTGVITYVSKAFCEISGFTEDELIGNLQNIVRHPEMSKELFEDLWSSISNGQTWRGEIKNKKKNGGFYWVDVVIEPEFDENKKIIGFSAIHQDITSKKEVEELSSNLEIKVEERTLELKESEKRFITLFDAAPDSISIIKDGKYMDCNQKTLELFGVKSRSTFKKTKPSDYSPEFQENGIKSETLATQRIYEAIKNGYNRFEWIHKRLDTNTEFYAEVILSSITLNEEPHIYAVVRDISERKKAQQKIADQKQYIDSIMNSQSNIVISTDGEKLRTANKAFFDFYKVKDVEEFLNTIGDCICDTFDASASKEFVQKMMGEEKWIEYVYNRPNEIHKTIIEKDGNKHIFTITSDRFEFAGEMLEVAVLTDITEIEAIRKNIETILSNIMLPVLITSKKDRKILYANEYASIQYEAEVEKLVGSSIDSVYTSLEQKDEILSIMSEHGYVENLEERYKTRTGREFIGLLSVKPIIYNGEDAYIGMVVDITKQKDIEEQIRQIHKHTQSSIEYASLIQHSLIPANDLFKKYFDDYFTIWHPKDIVGGDIYLFEELRNNDECLLMVIDCTGHGVPGAFVTMLVKAIERQVSAIIASDTNLEVSPAWILKYFNRTMKKLLKQEDDDAISNAGFDGAILYYNKKQNKIRFAGAELPLFYVEDEEIKMIKGDRQSIGYKKSNADYEFTEHIIDVKDGMKFYMTSDGYLDQNGGEKGFPFGRRRFQKILENYTNYSFADQQEVLLNELQEYQQDEERNDDVTIIGIKIGTNDSIASKKGSSWVI